MLYTAASINSSAAIELGNR